MLVEDLIKKLKELPKCSTIGAIDLYEHRLDETVLVLSNKDKVADGSGYETLIKDIEEARKSNKSRICDYYII